jgi:hypothetical protein
MRADRKDGVMNRCVECGTEFYAPPSHREKRSYCSRKCRASAQSKWQHVPLADRFWEKVDKSGECWIWTAAMLKTGYGSIRVEGKALRAHRVAYELTHGKIPEGMLLRHSCDNPKCVNPAHLIVGTKRENTQDALERGQHVVGEDHYKAKIPNQAIDTIRAALAAGVSGKYLAKQFGVDQSMISQIKHGRKRKYA